MRTLYLEMGDENTDKCLTQVQWKGQFFFKVFFMQHGLEAGDENTENTLP